MKTIDHDDSDDGLTRLLLAGAGLALIVVALYNIHDAWQAAEPANVVAMMGTAGIGQLGLYLMGKAARRKE